MTFEKVKEIIAATAPTDLEGKVHPPSFHK